MKKENSFYKTVCRIAIPMTLQSLLQSSFSVVDQIMVGQLGSVSVAGIGLGGKFASLYSVMVSAIATVAGIMIAQYMGKKDNQEVSRSFWINMILAVGLALVFTGVCASCSMQIMGLYSKDKDVRRVAAGYLMILMFSYLPMAITTLLSTLLRCMEATMLPLYASIAAAVINTGCNYVLIFGKFGAPKLGVTGAALATVFSQIAGCVMTVLLFFNYYRKQDVKLCFCYKLNKKSGKQYLKMLLPILACEFLWSLGENCYTAIYGNIGTQACAAMVLTAPIQMLFIGALTGVAQAAGIMIGKTLGGKEYDKAYWQSKKLMLYGVCGSAILSTLVVLFGRYYILLYQVEESVRQVAYQILIAFAIIAPVKVQNMILGGGIIRSGGETKLVMYIDMIGTWIFGVPLGLLTAFVLKLEIPYVYFILSLEECVRLLIAIVIFRNRRWMKSLE